MRKNSNRPNKQIWEIIAEGIKEDIIARKYKMAEWLKESELADKYGSSKTPVKEALRYLEGIGFVEITPYTGARVRTLNRDEVLALYHMQGMLEGYAARLAVGRLSEKRIEKLQQYLDLLKRYYKENKPIMYEKTNLAFHTAIWEGLVTNNLEEIILYVRDQLQRSRVITRYHLKMLGKKLSTSHEKIVEAINKKDGDLAEKAVRSHYAQSGEIVAKIVEREEKESN